ncbi:hypothetical protein [Streptomyces sp. NBC_01803]|nr:hypothetical protein [Streptomyces sp. NBC_01803]WSA45561.1 hypothetical protein OIE51_15955 [Streptomyces sp. NBC_01803]
MDKAGVTGRWDSGCLIGRAFVANPDLVERLRTGAGDRSTPVGTGR